MALKNNWTDKVNGIDDVLAEDINNIASSVIELEDGATGKEDKTNKVTSITSASTDTQYPTAKAVYTSVSGKEDKLNKMSDILMSMNYGTPQEDYPNVSAVFSYVYNQTKDKADTTYVDEQIGDIETALDTKEDKLNKVNDILNSIVNGSSGYEYPTVGATYGFVINTTQWKLIQTVTLTETVNRIYPTFSDNYKSIFVKFDIPTVKSETVTTVGAARGYLRVNNVVVHMNNGYEWEDIGATSRLSYKIDMIGTTCITEGRYSARTDLVQNNDRGKYAQNLQTNGGVTLSTNYISSCDVEIFSADTLRCFPAGTKYEIWGIKA